MQIMLPNSTQPADLNHWLEKIDDWFGMSCPKQFNPHELGLGDDEDIWIGCSVRHKVYSLKFISRANRDQQINDNTLLILIDPPKPDIETIVDILLMARKTFLQDSNVNESDIETLINKIEFPESTKAGELLSGIPAEWANFSAKIQFSCQLSDGWGINSEISESFERKTFADVVKTIFDKRHEGYLLRYSLLSSDVIPFLAWDVDCSLSRMFKERYEKRKKVSNDLFVNSRSDLRLVTLYQYLPNVGSEYSPSYFAKPSVRLRVGGISKEAAYSNWMKCAAAIRKLKP